MKVPSWEQSETHAGLDGVATPFFDFWCTAWLNLRSSVRFIRANTGLLTAMNSFPKVEFMIGWTLAPQC